MARSKQYADLEPAEMADGVIIPQAHTIALLPTCHAKSRSDILGGNP
jgi:hypothetical protein